ncbi:hypothetical protein [Curtobacterium sp. VKM Ac-2887]|uniref:hypothetical protein n=1 Tax=Curtobacterium sp. VKM Ac-2887 TaxID=2783819 RepID=UPI00188D6D98|nr:hypothetical protein [Curtobacterium sp. VKM Ac-2887]MBF4587952.1 hypothetical protein [Curtobacterium sp. VKM Ac-2887]
MNCTATPADQLTGLASGPAFIPTVVLGNLDHASWRTVSPTRAVQYWPEVLGGTTVRIGPSAAERVNLLDPLTLYGVGDAGPNQFIVGTPGVGHTMAAREVR